MTRRRPDTGFAAVALTRTGGSVVFVNVATSDGSATAGSDYAEVNQLVRFDTGETTKTVLIPIYGDRVREGNESVHVSLSSVTGPAVLGGQTMATWTILDND